MPNVRRICQQQVVRDEFKDLWHQVMQRLNRAEDSTLFCKSLRALMGLTWMMQDRPLVKRLLTAQDTEIAINERFVAELAFSGNMANFLNPVTHNLENPILIRQLKMLCGGLLVIGAARHGTDAADLLKEACRYKGTSGPTVRQRRRAAARNDPTSNPVASTMHPSQSSLSSFGARPATSTVYSVHPFSAVDADLIATTMAPLQQRSGTTAEVRRTAAAPTLTNPSTPPLSYPSQMAFRDESTILPFTEHSDIGH